MAGHATILICPGIDCTLNLGIGQPAATRAGYPSRGRERSLDRDRETSGREVYGRVVSLRRAIVAGIAFTSLRKLNYTLDIFINVLQYIL